MQRSILKTDINNIDYELKIGQEVWTYVFSSFRHTTNENEPKGFGKITKIFETDMGTAFYFIDEVNGGERMAFKSKIIMKPTPGMINALSNARLELNGNKDKKKK